MSLSPVPSHQTERARVLVLVKGLGIGGAERLIAEAAPLWNRELFDYRVAYLLPWKDQLVSQIVASNTRVTCLDWRGVHSLPAIWRLRRLVKTWQPEIVHSHLPAAGILARLAVADTNHVYTEHNVVDSYKRSSRWLNRVTYARNRAVIAVSEAVAKSLEGYPGPQPTVIPNGVTVEVSDRDAKRARAELGLDQETPLLVHVGNIRPHKGHQNLIDAVAYLMKMRFDFVVVSIGGEKHQGDLERVRSRAQEAGLNQHLRFLGRRPDALFFLAAADVVVNPADVEGLPLSVLEALALGKPVVATDVGGVSSVVEHERSGLLVPPGDPESLALAMDHALRSPEASRWGEEGARIVTDRHGLGQMVRAYEELYQRVLNG